MLSQEIKREKNKSEGEENGTNQFLTKLSQFSFKFGHVSIMSWGLLKTSQKFQTPLKSQIQQGNHEMYVS